MAQGGVACGVLTLLLTVIVCLPIVLILRVDGTVTWSWLLVFIPFWLVNALLCVAIFGRPCFAARAEDAKAADVIALVPWKVSLAWVRVGVGVRVGAGVGVGVRVGARARG